MADLSQEGGYSHQGETSEYNSRGSIHGRDQQASANNMGGGVRKRGCKTTMEDTRA